MIALATCAALGACTVVESTDEAGEGGATGEGGDSHTGTAGDSSSAAGSDADVGGAGGVGGGTSVELLDCESRDVTDATEVSTDVREDTTWSGTVLVQGAVTVVDGATLTIEPGTNVIMDVDSELEIGWNSGAATLKAEGTSAAPVRFCGKESTKGYWSSLIVGNNVTSDSVLSHVLISDSGGTSAALVLNADIAVKDVQVRNSGSDGVWATDFKAGSAGLSAEGNDGAPVVLLDVGAATRFPLGGLLQGNSEQLVRVRFETIEEDTTFAALPVHYLQEKAVTTRDGSVLTFAAGVDYRFTADTYLEVGWNSSDAELQIEGTEAEPVRFSGDSNTPGFWGGLLIGNAVRSNSKLSYLELEDAGGSTHPAIEFAAPVIVDHVSLANNELGVYVGAKGLETTSSDLSITTTAGVPLTVAPDALVTLPTGGSFTGNDEDLVAVNAGDYTEQGTVPNLGVPYLIKGEFSTRMGSKLVLEPGTHFRMTADAFIEIGWNSSTASFEAVGTAAEPIVFSGEEETAGYWGGIIVGSDVSSASGFEFVEVAHAGGPSVGAALKLLTPIDVKDSTFSKSAGFGILKRESDATTYTTSNTFTDVASGSVGDI